MGRCSVLGCQSKKDAKESGVSFHTCLLSVHPGLGSFGYSSSCRPKARIQVKYKPYLPKCPSDHDFKNMNLNRPMSPHLSIYAPNLVMTTSILQRMTGVTVTLYTTAIAIAAFMPQGLDSLVHFIWSLNFTEPQISLFKFLIGLPYFYHYFFGIRFHLFNLGLALDLKSAWTTAYICLALFAPVSLFFAIL